MVPVATATAACGPSEVIRGTAKQFAERFGLLEADPVKGYVHATALIRLLQELGLAVPDGVEKAESGKKGKGAVIWKVPSQILLTM